MDKPLLHPFLQLRSGLVQHLGQLRPVIYAVLKTLRHLDRIRWAGLNAEVAHGAELEMIYELINGFLLLALRSDVELRNDLDGAVRTGQFTGRTPCAPVFICLCMLHHHFTPESLREYQAIPVIRILLRDDLLMMRKIIHRTPHACGHRPQCSEDISYILFQKHFKSVYIHRPSKMPTFDRHEGDK